MGKIIDFLNRTPVKLGIVFVLFILTFLGGVLYTKQKQVDKELLLNEKVDKDAILQLKDSIGFYNHKIVILQDSLEMFKKMANREEELSNTLHNYATNVKSIVHKEVSVVNSAPNDSVYKLFSKHLATYRQHKSSY